MPIRLIVLLGILSLAGLMLGQSFLGSIGGGVTDSSGAVVLQAKVAVTEVATAVQRTTTTNSEGKYFFPDLPPGTYQITVSAVGFKDVRSSDIILTAQQATRFDATLQVGEATQTVNVTAAPPTLNTENAELGNVLPRTELLNLPLNERSTLNFFMLSSFAYQGDGSSYSLGGLRGQNTNFTIDGVSSNSSIFGGQVGPMTEETLESVREMKLLSSNNSAEFPNVGTLIISSRSGENNIHGSGFYIGSNYALNARSFFASSKPSGFYRHQWGGSFGGPVYVPHLYDGHNRTFFYFTFEQGRFPETDPTTASVPTDKMRGGDFSELLPDTAITDPTTGNPFPGNIMPPSRISPVAQAFQSFGFVPPNTSNPSDYADGNWQGFQPVSDHDNRWVGRIDHQFRSSDTLSGRISWRQAPEPPQFDTSLNIFQHHQHRETQNAYISETHLFSPRLVNEARFGFSRDFSGLYGIHKGADIIKQTGLQGINADPNLTGVPVLNFNNFNSMNEFPNYFWMSKTFEYLDNMTFTTGRHNIKWGALVRHNRPGISDNPYYNGSSDFGAMSFDGFATGFDYADFLLGLPHSTDRYVRSLPQDNVFTDWGLFAQDSFRVSNKLTVELGLRWELYKAPVDTHDMRFSFDPSTGNLVVPNQKALELVSPVFPKNIPIVTAQQAGFPSRSLLDTNYKDFAPRLSFAYRPFAGGNTVIRSGYGIFYSSLVNTRTSSFFGSGSV